MFGYQDWPVWAVVKGLLLALSRSQYWATGRVGNWKWDRNRKGNAYFHSDGIAVLWFISWCMCHSL